MESFKYNQKNHIMNIGIGILRMFLCFLVITFHYAGNKNQKKYKILNSSFHVPTFMLISFYFSYKILISNDIIKYKKRFQRLLIPYIIWPIIFLAISNFEFSLNSIYIKKLLIDLFLQYITGYKIMVILWFIQILIFFELIFQIIYFLFKNRSFLIFQILLILSYF
jgi:fucose 4-O-acetylase-like acetyltransferase